jgi:hypothetical protein
MRSAYLIPSLLFVACSSGEVAGDGGAGAIDFGNAWHPNIIDAAPDVPWPPAIDTAAVEALPVGWVTAASCPSYASTPELVRACDFDSSGKTYALGGELHALPQTPPYGAMFVFEPDSVPAAPDVTTAGVAAAVRAYAGPYDSFHPVIEMNEANRIPAGAMLEAGGAVVVWVSDAVPAGYQVAFVLDYDGLYRSRRSPSEAGACTWPSAALCARLGAPMMGTRFYVGELPADLLPRPPIDAADPTTPCLLDSSAAATSARLCCYRKNGANTCASVVTCDTVDTVDAAACCRVSATENTTYGRRCCLYADGRGVDGATECAQLLASGK